MSDIPARRSYSRGSLEDGGLPDDPLAYLRECLSAAAAAGNAEPNAMALATATAGGLPSVRYVLLKGVADGALVFYTNYASRKADELEANPRAAAALWWPELERQVRVEGTVARTSRAESEAYFRTRPRGSQLGAWASPQGREVRDRAELEGMVRAVSARFAAGELPLPDDWGGYRLTAQRVEIWQGREDRLHDRFAFTLDADEPGGWRWARLAP